MHTDIIVTFMLQSSIILLQLISHRITFSKVTDDEPQSEENEQEDSLSEKSDVEDEADREMTLLIGNLEARDYESCITEEEE